MSFILWDQNERYRKRTWTRIFRFAVLIGCIVATALIAFDRGQQKAQNEISSYKQHIKTLNTRIDDFSNKVMNTRASCQTLQTRYKQLQESYQKDVPKGDIAELCGMLQKQIKSGLSAERMSFLIRSAQPPHNCTDPETKRFVLSTPLYQGPDSFVSFGNNTIMVKGSGQPGTNENGETEAWFDPGKPVRISFTKIGGKTEEKEGILPLHHTIVVGEREYRFTIAKGPQSFIIITADNCDYIY